MSLCDSTLPVTDPITDALAWALGDVRPAANPRDGDYVARARTGDARAFRELYSLHRKDVARVVARLLGPRGHSGAVEDVVQDVFVQVFRALPNFRAESRFSTWLHSVATHVALMHLRAARSRPSLSLGIPMEPAAPDDDSPLAGASRQERLRALDRILARLSDKKRVVFVLHDLEGMSAAEVAQSVGAPVLTVRTRLFYARKEVYAAMARDLVLAPVLHAAGLDAPSGGSSTDHAAA